METWDAIRARRNVRAYKDEPIQLQKQTGFVRYGLADMGEKICLSFSIWSTREDALAAETVATNGVGENLGHKVMLRSSHVGSLAFFEGVLATV